MAFGATRRCQRTEEVVWGTDDGRSTRESLATNDHFEVEGSISRERATIVCYGDATARSLTELDAALDGVVAHHPSVLTVDLSATSSMDIATVRAIAECGRKVSHFDLRLPFALA